MRERAGGLDLGLSKDWSVYAEASNRNGLVVVEHLVSWHGQRGRKVDLEEVEREVAILAKRSRTPIYYDPYQGVLMAQRLQSQGLHMIEYPFSGESRRRLFSVLLDLVRGRRLKCRPHDALRRELLGLEVTQTAAGWRVDHKVGRHDDHVVAVALAAQAVAGEHVDMTEALAIAAAANTTTEAERRAATDRRWREMEFEAVHANTAPWDVDE